MKLCCAHGRDARALLVVAIVWLAQVASQSAMPYALLACRQGVRTGKECMVGTATSVRDHNYLCTVGVLLGGVDCPIILFSPAFLPWLGLHQVPLDVPHRPSII
jgi:hypothetical protein